VQEPFLSVIEFTSFNYVRQTEIHTAKPLVPEMSAFEIDMTIEKLKRQILPGIDPIPAELIKAGGRKIRSETHTHFNSIWNKKDLPEESKESIIVPTYKKGNKTNCSNYKDMLVWSITYKILSNIMLRKLHMQRKFLGIISMDFDATSQLLIIYSVVAKYWRKMVI
jgi:hypothetical protein